MIVIHPYDKTTQFLKPLYGASENLQLCTEQDTNAEIRRVLNHVAQPDSPVMMLGHGCEYGLFAPVSPAEPFGRLIVNGTHVEFLRKLTCFAIWCNANLFAEKYNLHGIFSGMIISELEEADWCGVQTTPEELECENNRLTALLKDAFLNCPSLADIPDYIKNHAPMDTPLQRFNYNNIYYYS